MIGATRESVNKQLGWMRDHRLIELDRRRLILLRPEELRKRIYWHGLAEPWATKKE